MFVLFFSRPTPMYPPSYMEPGMGWVNWRINSEHTLVACPSQKTYIKCFGFFFLAFWQSFILGCCSWVVTLFSLKCERWMLCSVSGDLHRMGTRQTTGYMSWTKGYRTGQRSESCHLLSVFSLYSAAPAKRLLLSCFQISPPSCCLCFTPC